ncbi:hypothetical protein [Plebeiibacterium marinum]|uniref:Uncharacterized protein n=1 Tax=Plebeiibacterium marinum TaxID=2992111 RepID=A0AAE3SKP3_9BACT|nr:hypothetical protein [Plebeiobacterium marinum]MCW3806723.1 hypothetical protein [Plebeiobacterium marinum]
MDYLEATVFLKQLIKETNNELLAVNKNGLVEKNRMVIRTNFGKSISTKMEAFTNEYVYKSLGEYESEAFVITDLVSAEANGQEITYFLYKGYHSLFDKGVVYFQMVDKNTLAPKGELDFSNLEENIFYKVEFPDVEESSCNAIETAENTAKNPSIAFLIGHMNEERLVYDINRLIFDTANNVQKHKNRHFKFTIQVSVFGSKPSANLLKEIENIKQTLKTSVHPAYPNSTFVFDVDNE